MTLADIRNKIASKARLNKRGCLIWNGAMSQSGWRGTFYPVMRLGTKTVRLNRLVLLLNDVDGLDALDALYVIAEAAKLRNGVESSHECDDSRCIRPEHLAWKTHAYNISEQVARRNESRR